VKSNYIMTAKLDSFCHGLSINENLAIPHLALISASSLKITLEGSSAMALMDVWNGYGDQEGGK
jgi:hypothetical protein